MTKSPKIEYVTTCMGETLSPSHVTYSLVSTLLSLVASCKQRDGLVGFSFVSKHQQTAASQSPKAHKATARANDVFDLSVQTFCNCVCTPVFPGIQDVGFPFAYGVRYRAHLRYISAPSNRYPSLQNGFHLFPAFKGCIRPFEEKLEGKIGTGHDLLSLNAQKLGHPSSSVGIYQLSLYRSLTQRPELRQRSQSLSSVRMPSCLNGWHCESLIAMCSYRRTSTPTVVLPVFSISTLLSEGAGCHRGLGGGGLSPKTPNKTADGQSILSLYTLNNDTRPAFQTVRLGRMGRLTKWPTTQKQAENMWVGTRG